MKKYKLLADNTDNISSCVWCSESGLEVGSVTKYGAIVIARIGKKPEESWFATLSPKTAGNVNQDFTLQLMPVKHLTHFAQIASNNELAKNYGLIFSLLSRAMANIIADGEISSTEEKREDGNAIATYGKCTNWKEKKEHLHVKLYPFRGILSQPCVVDSSFERKEVFTEDGEKFVKMTPIKKSIIPKARLKNIAERIIKLIKSD